MKDFRKEQNRPFNLNYVESGSLPEEMSKLFEEDRIVFINLEDDLPIKEFPRDKIMIARVSSVYGPEHIKDALVEIGAIPSNFPSWIIRMMGADGVGVEDDFNWIFEEEDLEKIRSELLIYFGKKGQWSKSILVNKKGMVKPHYATTYSLKLSDIESEFSWKLLDLGFKGVIDDTEMGPNQKDWIRPEDDKETICRKYLGETRFNFYYKVTNGLRDIHLLDIKTVKVVPEAVLKKIDLDYWDGSFGASSVTRAGARLEDLFEEKVTSCLSREEKHRMVKAILNPIIEVNESNIHVNFGSSGYAITKSSCGPILGINMIDPIYEYCTSILQCKWISRNKDRLEGYRTIMGPGGRRIRNYNHRILRCLFDHDLDRGIYTGFNRMYELAQSRMTEELKLLLRESIELPVFPINIETDKIKQLKSSYDLWEEGEMQNHCVGTYVKACMDEECYIFSVTDEDGKAVTVELAYNRDIGRYEVVQSKGLNNQDRHDISAMMNNILFRHKKQEVLKALEDN